MSESSDLQKPSEPEEENQDSLEDDTSSIKSKVRILGMRRRHQAELKGSCKVSEPKGVEDLKISLVFPRVDPQNA